MSDNNQLNNSKDIQYTSGGIGHTKESFSALVDRSYDFLSKLVNIDERIKIISSEKNQKKVAARSAADK
jgi:hypothetical protein